jgi:hypothetical protein
MRPTTQLFYHSTTNQKCKSFCKFSKFVSPLSEIQNFTAFYYFNFARLPSRSTISRYNLKMRSRATSSTLVRLENFNTSAGNFGNSLLIELPFWIQFNFTLRKWKCQSPPWLSRWRTIRRVLIHTNTKGERKRNWNWLTNYERKYYEIVDVDGREYATTFLEIPSSNPTDRRLRTYVRFGKGMKLILETGNGNFAMTGSNVKCLHDSTT